MFYSGIGQLPRLSISPQPAEYTPPLLHRFGAFDFGGCRQNPNLAGLHDNLQTRTQSRAADPLFVNPDSLSQARRGHRHCLYTGYLSECLARARSLDYQGVVRLISHNRFSILRFEILLSFP